MANNTDSGKTATALVTGGCGGLGRAISEAFLSQGTNVVAIDISDDMISKFNSEVASAHGDRVLVLKKDVTVETDLDSLFQEAADRFKQIDYVVNNAAIMDRFDPAGDLDLELWNRVIAVNLTAPTMITKRAVNHWTSNSTSGAIVNISSIAGFKGFCAGTAYTASKHGLLGLTKSTATYYQSNGIRCNAICAGGMDTNITSAFSKGVNMPAIEKMYEKFPYEAHKKSVCEVEKVAGLVTYLCSPASSIVNGAIWTADGGITSN